MCACVRTHACMRTPAVSNLLVVRGQLVEIWSQSFYGLFFPIVSAGSRPLLLENCLSLTGFLLVWSYLFGCLHEAPKTLLAACCSCPHMKGLLRFGLSVLGVLLTSYFSNSEALSYCYYSRKSLYPRTSQISHQFALDPSNWSTH